MERNKKRTSLVCKNCGVRFYPKGGSLKQKCCSKKCSYELRSKTPSKKKGKKYPHLQRARIGTCVVCGKEFRAIHDFVGEKITRIQKYCSVECWSNRGELTKQIYTCNGCGKQFYASSSKKRKYCSRKCAHKHMIGKNASCYKNGLSLTNERARSSSSLKVWRDEVYKRDGYECKMCGSKKHLNAHHIKSFSEYEKSRFDIENGITLCEKCHGEIHGKDFSNRRNKKCVVCGCIISNQSGSGLCRSCAIKKSWTIRKKNKAKRP